MMSFRTTGSPLRGPRMRDSVGGDLRTAKLSTSSEDCGIIIKTALPDLSAFGV